MVFIRTLAAAPVRQMLAMGPAQADPGKLDGNGHYETATGEYHCHKQTSELKPNRSVNSPAKKPRENLCHDQSPSNYETMAGCLSSGGRPAG